MRIAKSLILALTVALSATALIGAPSAMADGEVVLCKVSEEECPAEEILGYGFTALADSTFNFGPPLGKFECVSPMARSHIEKMALYFGSCTEAGCSVETLNLFYEAEFLNPGEGDGELWIKDGGKGEPQFAVTCEANKCVYGGAMNEFTFEGGEPANIHVHHGLEKISGGFFCPPGLKWEANYEILAFEGPVYLAKHSIEGLVFCEAFEEACAHKYTVPSFELSLKPATKLSLGTFPGGSDITCGKSKMTMDDPEPYVNESPWELGLTDHEACAGPVYTGCELSSKNTPYTAVPEPGEGGDGALAISESTGSLSMEVSCSYLSSPFTCTYTGGAFPLEFDGGETGSVNVNIVLGRESGPVEVCGEVLTLEGEYEVSGPGAGSLYLTGS
jgi:hypothetical protein